MFYTEETMLYPHPRDYYITLILILGQALKCWTNPLLWASGYLRVLAAGAAFMLFGTGFATLLRAEGAVKVGFLGNLAETALNLILDPLLILKFDMGIVGAAAATVMGNLFSSGLYLWFIFRKSSLLTLHPSFALRCPKALVHIFALGLPNAVSSVLSGLASTFSNRLLNPYGTDALAAMGAAGKVTLLITLVQMGVCMGVQPLMAYNYGAHNLPRLREILQKLAILTVGLGIASTVVCCLARRWLISLFLHDESAAAMGEQMVAWLLMAGPLLGLYYLSSNFLQASGKAAAATAVSILRQGADPTAVLDAPAAGFYRHCRRTYCGGCNFLCRRAVRLPVALQAHPTSSSSQRLTKLE